MPWDDPRFQYRRGDFWRIDDRSGFKVRASKTKKEWTGRIVRETDWEPRHPQDGVRGRPLRVAAPNPSPEPATDTFLNVGDVTADDL